MTLLEAYSFLFFDSLFSTLAFVPNTTMVYKAMMIFGGYQKEMILSIARIGSLLGVIINYLFGIILGSVKKKKIGDSGQYKNLQIFSQKYLVFLSIFSFIPIVGVIITTFLGMMRTNFVYFTIAAFIGRAFFYQFII